MAPPGHESVLIRSYHYLSEFLCKHRRSPANSFTNGTAASNPRSSPLIPDNPGRRIEHHRRPILRRRRRLLRVPRPSLRDPRGTHPVRQRLSLRPGSGQWHVSWPFAVRFTAIRTPAFSDAMAGERPAAFVWYFSIVSRIIPTALYSDLSPSWRAKSRHPRNAMLVQTKTWMAGLRLP